MAAPNIKTATTFTGKTAVLAVTTVATDIVSNAAASGKVLKINTLRVANVDGSTSANITASVYRSSTEYPIAYTVAVPADNSLDVLDKGVTIYLEEGDSLRLTASANGDLVAVCSYEEIS